MPKAKTRKKSTRVKKAIDGSTPTQNEMMALLPVTVLSGFLGAGKTTLLKRILSNPATVLDAVTGEPRPQKIAVIVNDMGEVNLDAKEIKNSRLIKEDATMVELHNGCICCTLRGDLLVTVKALSEEATFDYLVIESSGISEPLPVAQTFVMDVTGHEQDGDDEGGGGSMSTKGRSQKVKAATEAYSSLSNFARLDTLCTVVDSTAIYDVLDSLDDLSDPDNLAHMEGNGEEDVRSLAQLLLDQIDFANVIVLSKTQRLLADKNGTQRVEEITQLLNKLNPLARVVVSKKANYADVDVHEHLINTRLFKMEEATSYDVWIKEMEKEHTPETEEYGISGLVFRADRPFHPQRLHDIMRSFGNLKSAVGAASKSGMSKKKVGRVRSRKQGGADAGSDHGVFRGVVRSKGSVWLANSMAYPMTIHTAGKNITVEPVEMPFMAAVPEEHWDDEDRRVKKELQKAGKWSKEYGDRKSEIILIGVHSDKVAMEQALAEALIGEKESKALGGIEGYRALPDPFFDGDAAEEFFDIVDDSEECLDGTCAFQDEPEQQEEEEETQGKRGKKRKGTEFESKASKKNAAAQTNTAKASSRKRPSVRSKKSKGAGKKL